MKRTPRGRERSTACRVDAARNGLGVLAERDFASRAAIAPLRGRIVHWTELWRRSRQFASNCIRYGPETYLDPSGGLGRYLNHSCEPNAGIRKSGRRLVLFAARAIRRGEEIVIDYATTIGDDDIWRMKCKCGARRCRGWVTRFGSLSPRRRQSYVRRGLVPDFILATLG